MKYTIKKTTLRCGSDLTERYVTWDVCLECRIQKMYLTYHAFLLWCVIKKPVIVESFISILL